MKNLIMLMIVLSFSSCAGPEKKSWDGAQRQEAAEEESRYEQQDQVRDQFPQQRQF